MAKSIRVATVDSGAAYNIIPGSTGALTRDGDQLDDTVFGQIFKSSQPGLINWGVTSNGFYKGFAGYVADLLKSGTSTVFTDEAMTLVSGLTYKITDNAKSIWDRTTPGNFTFADSQSGGGALTASVIDYLFGEVTFASLPSGAIPEATGDYLPTSQLGKANAFTLTQTGDTVDTTDLATAQANNGFATFVGTLLTVGLELSEFYDVTEDFHTVLTDREELIIEINPDGNVLSRARGFFKAVSAGQTGDVGGNEIETVSFQLAVPTDITEAPFSWRHDSATTLNQAIQDILNSWESQALLFVQYLPDGAAGYDGQAVVTEATLVGGVNVMNEFSFTFQGSGALAIESGI